MKTLKWIALTALFLAPIQAAALTGAEFKQADRRLASGYVLGALEDRIYVVDTDDPKIETVRNCVFAAGMNTATLYDLTISWLNRNPKDLQWPVVGAIRKAINEMCEQ
jgi:hypothetical protein